jgi:cobalt-zinc-cadmium resistance protein CzcA
MVQRPLATVVIGGLITATVLTLLLFPTVYAIANGSSRWNPIRGRTGALSAAARNYIEGR